MRAIKTRAGRKIATESSAGAKSSEEGKRRRSEQRLPSRKSTPWAGSGAAKGRYGSGHGQPSVPQRADISAWSQASLPAVISHILSQHHRLTYQQLGRLEKLFARVVEHHAHGHPELTELQELFLVLSDKLTTHMIREEQMVFPYILRLEEAAERGERLARPVFGSVRDPIDVLMVEHEGMKAAFEKIRFTAGGFAVPPGGSADWRALAKGMIALEQDFLRHVQIEDMVVFPRAVGAENSDRYLIEV